MNMCLNIIGCGLLSLLVAGCSSQPAATPPAKSTAAKSHDEHGHNHHGAGPHGGTIAEWGGGAYHIEFTVDHDKRQSIVYVMGEDAKSAAPIKAAVLLLSINDPSFQVELDAQPLDGETEGVCSRFVGQHDSLGMKREFTGSVTAEVDGVPYAGDFSEAETGHDHAHE